ncbi:hypothetical protein [Myxococcus sp. SDU36]|uniref:hypothetical protein n=1 Tax=Myxococcus sp. SDU36 TaxID=2831967 RepID=UPI002542909F|nr:hypothetical protein [Myxococcus sp. SDU36]WIG98739.1 hypothetical protein KGD87_15865 [Myxococcus sp. SDU36]
MPASPCPTPSSMLSKAAPADILTHVSKDSAKATAFLIRAFCAPTQDAEATRFVRAFGQASYLTRLETDPSVDAAYGSTASRFRSRWRTRVRRDARFIAALGSFKNTPFLPHFKRVLEDGTGEDRVVALAGALLVRPADKRGEKSLSTWLKDADPALLAKAHAFLRRHRLA